GGSNTSAAAVRKATAAAAIRGFVFLVMALSALLRPASRALSLLLLFLFGFLVLRVFGKLVRDALVAIDTGEAFRRLLEHDLRRFLLLVRIHRVLRMTVAALERIARLHRIPHAVGQLP